MKQELDNLIRVASQMANACFHLARHAAALQQFQVEYDKALAAYRKAETKKRKARR